MKTLLMLMLCLVVHASFGQELVVDPTTSGAILLSTSTINGQLNKTNDKLDLIQKSQLAVSGQLVIVNDMQNKIYQGLSQVASVINNLTTIKDIADCGTDIVQDVQAAVN